MYDLHNIKKNRISSEPLVSSVLPPETTRGGGRAARWWLLTRPQDPRVGGDVSLLNSPSVVFRCWGACREQGLEKWSFLWRPVLSIKRWSGPTALPLTGSWSRGGRIATRGHLGLDCVNLGQGVRLPPQVGFDQRQAVLQLRHDLVLRRSQWKVLDEATGEEVKVKGKVGGEVTESEA